jgi:hypothetical protein
MASITGLGVHTIQLPHTLGQIAIRRLDQQMIVIGHHAPGVTNPVEVTHYIPEHINEPLTIGIIRIDRFAAIPACGHVVQRTTKFNAHRPTHGNDFIADDASMLNLTT